MAPFPDHQQLAHWVDAQAESDVQLMQTTMYVDWCWLLVLQSTYLLCSNAVRSLRGEYLLTNKNKANLTILCDSASEYQALLVR